MTYLLVKAGGKVGRKSKYYEKVEPKLELIKGWCRDGITDEKLAEKLGIAISTLYDYKNKYSEFSEALKEGKEYVDLQVENALLKRALGYEYEQVTIEGGVVTKKVTKQVAPDTTAQIFWLKNRRPDKWREKQDKDNEDALAKLDSLLERQKDA